MEMAYYGGAALSIGARHLYRVHTDHLWRTIAPMKEVTLLICGAGDRGTSHGLNARDSAENARVVGVAEPREFHRNRAASTHGIPEANVFTDWREMAARDRFADAVVITTQDRMHVEPLKAFAAKGYHILLEKPIAPSEAECEEVITAVKDAGVVFGVGHVLRYTDYNQKIKEILDAGAIGDIVSIQHLEPVAYWHQAHSYVRGNWRNEAESSFMLLAKSCHDIDLIHYFMNEKCTAISSFGSLKHFRPENKPDGASDRCVSCAVESTCPYSAKKIYLGWLAEGHTDWPVNVVDPEPTEESLLEALRTGPYGRCVYACDNDVVDNQVVNMTFAGGQTATFTMTAFTKRQGRQTQIFGTRGQLTGDSRTISVYDFLTDRTTTIDTAAGAGDITGGHGGGDYNLMKRFVEAVRHTDQGMLLTGADETLASHRMVFAAEQARKEGRVVDLS
jgi:predicted dehydrogenase